jgi:2-polyprenyl-3-methyl-5-hydroxy-6-metoxy-1,4-benzoquinol methylase
MSTDENAVASVWNQNADYWVKNVRFGKDRIRDIFLNPLFFEFLGSVANLRILDLGCGEGNVTRHLRRSGALVTGIDISDQMIAAAREAERESPLGIEYKLQSICTLDDIEDRAYDCVVSTMVLMDSPRLNDVVRSVGRVLRPGGSFYFTVIHPCFWACGWPWPAAKRTGTELAIRYWSKEPYTEGMDFKLLAQGEKPGLTVLRFPYRLEDYVDCLSTNGFRMRQLKEARPTKEMVDEHSWLVSLREYVPLFLYVAATREE